MYLCLFACILTLKLNRRPCTKPAPLTDITRRDCRYKLQTKAGIQRWSAIMKMTLSLFSTTLQTIGVFVMYV